MRPIHNLKNYKQTAGALNRGDKKFEWTQKAQISLKIEESEIFEQQPVILESKMLRIVKTLLSNVTTTKSSW